MFSLIASLLAIIDWLNLSKIENNIERIIRHDDGVLGRLFGASAIYLFLMAWAMIAISLLGDVIANAYRGGRRKNVLATCIHWDLSCHRIERIAASTLEHIDLTAEDFVQEKLWAPFSALYPSATQPPRQDTPNYTQWLKHVDTTLANWEKWTRQSKQ